MGSCRKRKQSDVTSASSSASLQDVIVPFRERIPANTSTFSIQVPRHYAPNRSFHFSRLFLSPNLFNVEARELKLEAKIEEQITEFYSVNLTAHYPDPKAFFVKAYNNKMPTTAGFITTVNAFFDAQKPEFAMQCPFFLTGWTSTIRATITKLMLDSLA